jgi:hypothetical protein
VNAKIHQQLANRKSRMERRLDKKRLGNLDHPMFTAANIHYEIADRTRGFRSDLSLLRVAGQRPASDPWIVKFDKNRRIICMYSFDSPRWFAEWANLDPERRGATARCE